MPTARLRRAPAPVAGAHHALVEARGTRYRAGGPAAGRAAGPATADRLAVADPDALRRRLDAAAAVRRIAPGLAVVVGVAVVVVGLAAGLVAAGLAAVGGAVVLGLARRRDRRRTVVAATHHLPHRAPSVRHEHLVATWERVRTTSWEPAVWELGARGRHHGVTRRDDGPRHLRADVAVPTFRGRRRDVAFLPDRVVLREGRRHTVVAYDDLVASVEVRERAEGGQVGRLSLRTPGVTVVYELASVDAALALAVALRTMTGTQWRRAPESDRPARAAARLAARRRAVDSARARVAAVPAPRRASDGNGAGGGQADATGSPCASPTVAL